MWYGLPRRWLAQYPERQNWNPSVSLRESQKGVMAYGFPCRSRFHSSRRSVRSTWSEST